MKLIFAVYDTQKGYNHVHKEEYQNDETDVDLVKRVLTRDYNIQPVDMDKCTNYQALVQEMRTYALILSDNGFYKR